MTSLATAPCAYSRRPGTRLDIRSCCFSCGSPAQSSCRAISTTCGTTASSAASRRSTPRAPRRWPRWTGSRGSSRTGRRGSWCSTTRSISPRFPSFRPISNKKIGVRPQPGRCNESGSDPILRLRVFHELALAVPDDPLSHAAAELVAVRREVAGRARALKVDRLAGSNQPQRLDHVVDFLAGPVAYRDDLLRPVHRHRALRLFHRQRGDGDLVVRVRGKRSTRSAGASISCRNFL